jgi:hypothetical protein
MTEPLEDRLRRALRARTERTTFSPDAWPNIQRRLRRQRARRLVPVLAAAVALVVLLALVPLGRTLLTDRDRGPGPALPPAPVAAPVTGIADVRDPAAAVHRLGRGVPGTPVAGITWTDAGGRNLLVLSRRELEGKPGVLTEPPAPTRTVRVYADHLVTKDGRTRQLREVRDGVSDCELEITAEAGDGSLRVTDADHDGLGEVSFAWRLGCHSDVSEDDFRLVLLEGGAQYLVKGSSYADPASAEGLPQLADGVPEPAYSAWPPALAELARARYAELVVRG